MTIRIIECTYADELFCHYDGQTEAQPAYIELDLRNGTLTADYNGNIGNAVPETVRHGIDLRYPIPLLTGDAANRTMEKILPLANRIHADWEEVWNGSNMVAELGEDAKAADQEIEALLSVHAYKSDQGFDETDLVSVWDLNGSTNGCEVSEYDITAETTDERLDEIAIEIANDLVSISPSGVAVCPGLYKYLRGLRDDLEREKEDE